MKISVFGTGYVGLVTGVCFAEIGNNVVCVDVDPAKIEMLKQGKSPIYEPGLDELLKQNIKFNRLKFTTESAQAVQESEVIFIAVGTPPDQNGKAELKYVKAVAETIADHMTTAKLVITKSTVPVGSNEKIKNIIAARLKEKNKSFDFDVCSNPEFLREGSAIVDCLKPDRVVVGVTNDKSEEILQKLYEPFLTDRSQLLIMDIQSAEMTKYAANAMLATKISFMNEISRLCEKTGANIDNVRRGIASDHRIGPHFIYAGIGYGGSCFPKDVQALVQTAAEHGEEFAILNSVEKVNNEQRLRFVKKIKKHFKEELNGKSFAIWGVAFKPGTDDIRDAPSLDVIRELLSAGAIVNVYDPVAWENTQKYFQHAKNLHFVQDQYDVLKGVDALCIITEWKSFREPDYALLKKNMKSSIVFDGRNIYSSKAMKEKGFEYFSVGRV